ncbi:NapC/NirT family cytochrome c [Desulfitobacterium sp.]|uniref:NapC/NirT family cytochrome c n=1 Tax=Desulfitobacterium sp. TaxID=49981 RepID=UPI002B1F0CAC|nr:NapC/NirT family cytochrome c [Desulfitobacterium sp.]MEA4901134.1 NapC/NirT family cytochrome c [Desulfitobacterium sp.]
MKERLRTILRKLKFYKKEQKKISLKKRVNGLGLLLAIVLILIFFGGVGLNVTSSNSFCISCHEMQPEHQTFQVTSHAQFSCTTCHITPGVGNYFESKVKVLGYIGKHITGKYTKPIVASEPIPNQVCESCHSTMRKVTASGDINIPHDKHLQHDIACTACHGGVAHAFVAERGLTPQENLATWTVAKAEEVSKFDDTKTAMEACMDCHEQVNQGQRPWEENQGLGKTEAQRVAERQDSAKQAQEGNGKLTGSFKTLAKVGDSELTAPMRCAPCHLKIQTPVNHVDKSWGTTHGITAAQDIKWCAECHSRQRDRVLITAQTTVQDYARTNTLCAPCHEKRPQGHLASKQQWLPAHSNIVKDKGAQNCLVCHEIDKVTDQNNQKMPGVNAVTCNTCHWFKNGKVER